MVVFLAKSVIGGQFVSDNGAALRNEMLYDGDKGCSLGVSHLLRHLIGMCFLAHLTRILVDFLGFPHHRHTENGRLRLCAAPLRLLGFLAIVLVGFTPAKVHFIALYYTRKNHILLRENGANLMEDEPSGFLRHINVTAQLTGGNALLVAADKVHSHKPLLQPQNGHTTTLPQRCSVMKSRHLLSLLKWLKREIRELKCSSASLIVQGISIYLYLKTIVFLHKSPSFSCWTSIFYEIIGVNRYIVPKKK